MKHLVLAFALALTATPVLAGALRSDDLAALPESDVLVLGEVHDNPHHHENQAIALAAQAPRAIVFEMLDNAQAARVLPETRRDRVALEAALGWADTGWPDFSMYFPLFQAAPNAAVYGALVSRARLRDAIMGDAASVFGDDAARYGLMSALDPEQQAIREDLQMAAHCDALPEEMLPGMVMGQRLRDAALARAVLRALDETGGPVAVITGNGHARTDWGLPAVLAYVAPGLRVLSVGQLEAAPGDGDADPPYDHWVVTPAAEREDPCAAFR